MVLRAGAVDYVRDRLLPVLTLTTNDVKPDETPKTRLMRTVDTMLPSLKPSDGKIESQGTAKLGDQPAYQIVLGLTQRRERFLMAIRLAIRRGRALVLSLTYPAANAKQLTEAMDQVAGSFQFEQK
jgi:hypothetical protein